MRAETGDRQGGTDAVAAATYLAGPLSGGLGLAVAYESADTRFHAVQSVVASVLAVGGFVALTFAQYALTFVPGVGGLLSVAFSLVYPVYLLGLVVTWGTLTYRAYQGHRYGLPIAGRIASRYA